MNEHQPHHSVRRIVLPSGKSIEVVRFRESQEPTRRALHLCPECQSDLVQPVIWNEAVDDRWELTLKCPNCWWTTEGVFSHEEVHELEDVLDDGLTELLGDLRRLAHANMAEHIERFITALDLDLILPEDF